LAEEEGSEIDAGIDAGVVGGVRAEGDGLAEMAFGVGVAPEGDVIEARGALDLGGRGGLESEVKGFAGGFELAEGLAVASEKVAAIDGGLFEFAGAEEGGFGFGEAVGGDVGEAEAAPDGGVGFGVGEEEEQEELPNHGSTIAVCA